jgi:hypothetical protein
MSFFFRVNLWQLTVPSSQNCGSDTSLSRTRPSSLQRQCVRRPLSHRCRAGGEPRHWGARTGAINYKIPDDFRHLDVCVCLRRSVRFFVRCDLRITWTSVLRSRSTGVCKEAPADNGAAAPGVISSVLKALCVPFLLLADSSTPWRYSPRQIAPDSCSRDRFTNKSIPPPYGVTDFRLA